MVALLCLIGGLGAGLAFVYVLDVLDDRFRSPEELREQLGAPMLAASDAALVGRLTDGVVLVVQPEKNHRRLVLRAVEGLRALQVTLVGIVANNVGGADEAGYYGYGAGYGYGYGYTDGEADESAAARDDERFESDNDEADDTDVATPTTRPTPRRAA